MFKKSLKIPKG